MTPIQTTITTIAVLLVILALGFWYITTLDHKQASRELADSQAASALADNASSTQYTDFAGNPANLQQYLGQVLVVTSWASWSPSSAAELALLANTASSYADQGVIVLAINRAETKSQAERYLRSIGVAQQVRLIVDTDDRYYKQIGGFTMPETVFYDRRGNIVAHERGALTAGEVNYYIGQALSQE